MTARVLLVDDDSFTQQLFRGLLSESAIELRIAGTVAEAQRALQSTDFNLLILDQRLPDGNGLDLFAALHAERPQLVAILITGYAEVRDAVRAVREGLFDYLTKPFENLDELEAVIEKALELDRAYREIVQLREALDARPGHPVLIGRSAAMERLLMQVRQAAPLDTTVLIEGESGTGKEVIAKTLHILSPRAKAPLLELNCGALSEPLLEATLFGYEKGAFTSANKTTPGYFEDAHGGTLLLDEISDMSPKLQASLLRVLQEQTFARLGSTVQRPSDFRLICATNRSLETEMKSGRFRSDLFYRVNVVALHVPPLRERRDDIRPLALYFLDYFSRKFGKVAGPFTPEAMAAMEAAPWPGNVRQLQHAIERAVVVSTGAPLAASDLGLPGGQTLAQSAIGAPLPFREAREHFEREYFANLLRIADGNVSEAARLSGIARQNFHGRMTKLGLVAK
jgi:DNA-binding NtrC family response regulator